MAEDGKHRFLDICIHMNLCLRNEPVPWFWGIFLKGEKRETVRNGSTVHARVYTFRIFFWSSDKELKLELKNTCAYILVYTEKYIKKRKMFLEEEI